MKPEDMNRPLPFEAWQIEGESAESLQVLEYRLAEGASVKTALIRDSHGLAQTSIVHLFQTKEEAVAQLVADIDGSLESCMATLHETSKEVDRLEALRRSLT